MVKREQTPRKHGIEFTAGSRELGWREFAIYSRHPEPRDELVGSGIIKTVPADAQNALFADLVVESFRTARIDAVVAGHETGQDGPEIAHRLTDNALAALAIRDALVQLAEQTPDSEYALKLNSLIEDTDLWNQSKADGSVL